MSISEFLPIRFSVGLLVTGLLLSPAWAFSESAASPAPASGSGSLYFRVVIPPVIQLLANSHPMQLDFSVSDTFSAQQMLVVESNMKRGFCVSMRVSEREVKNWRMQVLQPAGLTLMKTTEGYSLCTVRQGRYTLLLQHEFDAAPDEKAIAWPVLIDISAV